MAIGMAAPTSTRQDGYADGLINTQTIALMHNSATITDNQRTRRMIPNSWFIAAT